MEFHRNRTPSVDGRTTVVTGPTLSEAFRRVRQEFGPDAVIAGSRTRSRRRSSGWGSDSVVEVLVETSPVPLPLGRDTEILPGELTEEVKRQVERVERLVEDICQGGPPVQSQDNVLAGNPLAAHLVAGGASIGAVVRLLTRFAGETGLSRDDRPGALAWLSQNLDTGHCPLEEGEGHHVFLGEHAADRLDLVLQLAGSFTEKGRRVLVVAVLPDPDRDEPRLKNKAAAAGHDAAVVRDIGQLQDMKDHLEGYDHVFLDLPCLADPRMNDQGPIHGWLASHEHFHRHLSVPMDRDFDDLDDLREAARSWNCDWLALTRLDGTRRPAKLLDLMENIPLPVSFTLDNVPDPQVVRRANPDQLLDRILAWETPRPFKAGVVTETS